MINLTNRMIKIIKIEVYDKSDGITLHKRMDGFFDLPDLKSLKKFRRHYRNMYFKGKEIDITFKEL